MPAEGGAVPRRGRRRRRRASTSRAELPAKLDGSAAAEGDLSLGIRPEGVLVAREAADGLIPVEAHIIEPLGAYDIVDLKIGDRTPARAHAERLRRPAPGDIVWARLDPAQTHFFDTASGAVARTCRLG